MKKRVTMCLMVVWAIFYAGTVWGASEGSSNNFFGIGAGMSTTGFNNSFFGGSAGYSNTTGADNSFFGHWAGYSNTTGDGNSFFGQFAGRDNTTGYRNSFFGVYSGLENITGFVNSFFGDAAGYSNTTGIANSFFGASVGYYNTSGGDNSFFGYWAGFNNTTGNFNSFFGDASGYHNTTGHYNTYIGRTAGYNSTGSGNVFLGYQAGQDEIGSNKLYIANSDTPLPLIYGEFDNQYLEVNGTLNVQATDAYNSFQYKVFGHTGGNSHTQMVTDLADSRFTVMAAEATDYAPRMQMTGPQDLAPAVQGWMVFDYGSANYPLPGARFVLRHFAGTGKEGYVNMMQTIGRDIIAFPTGNVGIGFNAPTHLIHLAGGAYSNGPTWVNASSRELKKNIQEVSAEEAIQTVENLKPVAFNYKEGDQDQHVGFIAEDVPELVATGDRKGLESMDIVAVLTKVVQEQQKTIQELLQRDEKQQVKYEEQQAIIGQIQTALHFKQDKDANVAQVDLIQIPEK